MGVGRPGLALMVRLSAVPPPPAPALFLIQGSLGQALALPLTGGGNLKREEASIIHQFD